jgi:YggT family protein
VNIVQVVLIYVLTLYLLLLVGRAITDMLQAYSRTWTPTGILARVAEVVYTLTDPPLRFLRRYIRPARVGNVAIDLSFTLLFVLVAVLLWIVSSL